ncbi:hypothetical protein [Methylovulum psychrotolerans]|uniref:hypothetical protein n=1 Tax=Methylovulum psychrotolerans TaxID=1704499 RepID=UPI000CDF12D4|nr:hypothetical protein [Methylovulum psychrotolerans]
MSKNKLCGQTLRPVKTATGHATRGFCQKLGANLKQTINSQLSPENARLMVAFTNAPLSRPCIHRIIHRDRQQAYGHFIVCAVP